MPAHFSACLQQALAIQAAQLEVAPRLGRPQTIALPRLTSIAWRAPTTAAASTTAIEIAASNTLSELLLYGRHAIREKKVRLAFAGTAGIPSAVDSASICSDAELKRSFGSRWHALRNQASNALPKRELRSDGG
jgi:hypothetical protein